MQIFRAKKNKISWFNCCGFCLDGMFIVAGMKLQTHLICIYIYMYIICDT